MPPASASGPVVLFDGVCLLCSRSVQWLIRRDRAGRLRFAALQSAYAAERLAAVRRSTDPPLPDSLILLHEGRLFTRSDAALRIAALLPLPWRVLAWLVVIPRPVRDWTYDAVARRRRRWFGVSSTCLRPTPELASRFLVDAEEDGGRAGRGE